MNVLRFKRRWWEELNYLPDEDFGEMMKAIFSYAFMGGIEDEISPLANVVVHLICAEIDEMDAESEDKQADNE